VWVRIREIAFSVDQVEQMVAHVRDTTVVRYCGEAYRGSRLLVDRPAGTALEVSYWQTAQGARDDQIPTGVDPTGVPGGSVLRTRYYELGIDAG
jgi:hypothetical protein